MIGQDAAGIYATIPKGPHVRTVTAAIQTVLMGFTR